MKIPRQTAWMRAPARSTLILPCVLAALFLSGGHRDLVSLVGRELPASSAVDLVGCADAADRTCCDRPLGGDIAPARSLLDPYPTFNGIAIDAESNLVVASDTNRKSLLVYDRARGARNSSEATKPLRQIIGPETSIGFVAGVAADPLAREIYAVNNDIEDTMVVFSYGSRGNARPVRRLAVPHQAWGVALSPSRDELAVSVESLDAVVVYRRQADALEAPRRVIRGPRTEMADPHGIYWDGTHQEIGVANHGNFRGLARNSGAGCVAPSRPDSSRGGELRPPSLTIYRASEEGDVKPLRKIEGPRTRLDWPMGIAVDPLRDEIFVANNGDNSVLVFGRTDIGDVSPRRVIRGKRTEIGRPMGVAVDRKSGGLWVANFGSHSAVFLSRIAQGDVEPDQVIRNAPAGTPTVGFGNPMALAYDSKRGEILVPN